MYIKRTKIVFENFVRKVYFDPKCWYVYFNGSNVLDRTSYKCWMMLDPTCLCTLVI